MGRIQVIAVRPDAAGLKPSPHPIRDVDVSRPYGRPQAVERIVADGERFGFILERCEGDDRTKDFLLENTHLIVPFENRRLHIVPAADIAADDRLSTAEEALRTFLHAN